MNHKHYWAGDLGKEAQILTNLMQDLDCFKIESYSIEFNAAGNKFDIEIRTEKSINGIKPISCPGIVESWVKYMGD